MIKMIALDLDNTLLTSDKTISKVNESALKKLHEQGIKVVLCTGRPINAIWHFIEQLGLTEAADFTITFNGALVIHNQDKQALAKSGMKKDDLVALHDFAQANDTPLDVLNFEQAYSITDLKKSIYEDQFNGRLHFDHMTFADLPDDQLYSKAILSAVKEELDGYVAKLPDNLYQQYHIVRSQPHILEFLAAGMDKKVGLSHLLDHFGWDFSNLMAFGDAENDHGMIEAAGVGVAMANASDEIKAVANETTLSNDEDGVAAFVEKEATQKLFK
ncbi:Cof-type HAD-IIB family hydrolase [Lentilactobacillus sp. Marseille-Q4993]|uniref:Cof-type HAD-IIB family hydrolase n=1 Tax=Lentilactobacillus sp. Marseille-Q4993 TaxID=3039492 RepID=UPI0024BC2AD0|nr:Cof-type HAD-IIB family hydrolase [Lentilactobacillus sp. Marseille-Q4993]